MPPPKKGDPGYEKYLGEFNERRRRRRQDPDYKAKETARQKASKARLAERRKQDEWERRHGKDG
ncbi:hypothetical protein [Mycobacteroides abscessus]|uniref:hypothetical protein n=1 Tax=Mycobacteroides abscessus TaxID=36809 RepID=UPI0009D02C72|nr:hypothetical protein [Mycobacteroides abscessus]SKI02257.1 Uncharacterised protein [Mycobacteroides abscessus subsp. massiliense]SKL85014.1 Uncharacterised protein [Mycobacteroides abscessus subsp. massiliense]